MLSSRPQRRIRALDRRRQRQPRRRLLQAMAHRLLRLHRWNGCSRPRIKNQMLRTYAERLRATRPCHLAWTRARRKKGCYPTSSHRRPDSRSAARCSKRRTALTRTVLVVLSIQTSQRVNQVCHREHSARRSDLAASKHEPWIMSRGALVLRR